MENNEQIDNPDDLKKSEDNLVDQELLNKISNINEFYKKFIDNEIDKNTESFNSWWNGDEDSKSFHQCKNDISNAITEGNKIPKLIEVETKNLKNLESEYSEKITELEKKINEIEIIKKDLYQYRKVVVLGTLFKTFQDKSEQNLKEAKIFSKHAIYSILGALLTLLVFAIFSHFFDVKEFYVFSMLILFITLSMFCSNKSKIYHKLAEEYAHKATFLESFVGYDEEFKKYLGNKYNDLFDKVTDAVSSSPSDKIDKFLQFRYPWEKIVDVGKKIADKVTNAVN